MSYRPTRREVLGKAIGLGAVMGLPERIWASTQGQQEPKTPASEKITLGFIGVGGQGNYLLGEFLKKKEVEVLAVSDVYEHSRNAAKKRVGDACATYSDYRSLLDRKDIDAVVIATPDHWHTLVSLHAAEAGKDIYCEKPLTLTIGEGRPLVNAARRYGRVFQVGSQQRSDANFRFACELVRNNKLGKLLRVETGLPQGKPGGDPSVTTPPAGLDWSQYLGPAPMVPFQKDRYGFNFRWFYDYSGGVMTDWGAHHNDIAQWGMGMDESGPVKIEGKGTFPTAGIFETATEFDVNYTYANGVVVNCRSTGRGAKFICEKGWIHVDRGFLEASNPDFLNIRLASGDVHLYQSNDHRQNFLDCIKSRKKPICDVEIGVRSATVCHLGNLALRTGRPLTWNPKTERFGEKEMNRWLIHPYRPPYVLPT